MSIHEISERLATAGVQHVVVTAKAAAKYKSIEAFAKSIKNDAAKEYAREYYDWVREGRNGAPPRCAESNHKLLKYIRMSVSQLLK